ncbi:MAG: D-alanyl-D-alanine carboxypeptidase/D-alanyl-D-alanine-endopeptidase [Actinomycetales bacterium]|nr:D-alanyl-D-alanine carboxypeptidase/D-alanyl-D-alanine-endopeptidase [Actinomycetales bacterium]
MGTVRLPRYLTAALASALSVTLIAAWAPASQAAPDPHVDVLISKRIENKRLGNTVGLLAVDAATGEVISDHSSDRPMLPASNMKIVTAFNALGALGPDTRFVTRVRAGATPGELILEGGGEPLLSTRDLRRLANKSARTLPAGTPITVHVDDDLFQDTGRAPGWPSGYVPSVVSNVHALARIWDYSKDPSANAAAVFVKRLTALGYPVTLGAPADAGDAAVIAATKGTTVADAVRVMLRISENNVAEVLYRQVAAGSGFPTTWAGSRQAAETVLTNLGVDPTGMSLLDGSGLSRNDRVSPRFLVNVLRVARVTNPAPFSVMFEDTALPIAGVSGTLDDRYGRFTTKQSRCAQGEIRAKTGTLHDTISLSGISMSADGERIFSILVNNRPERYYPIYTRQAVDGLAATINGCWN